MPQHFGELVSTQPADQPRDTSLHMGTTDVRSICNSKKKHTPFLFRTIPGKLIQITAKSKQLLLLMVYYLNNFIINS